jgi:hypothetical protein
MNSPLGLRKVRLRGLHPLAVNRFGRRTSVLTHQERMNSPLGLRKVRLRGLQLAGGQPLRPADLRTPAPGANEFAAGTMQSPPSRTPIRWPSPLWPADFRTHAPGANEFAAGTTQSPPSRTPIRLPSTASAAHFRTPHSALRTPHSALRTPHSALRTQVLSHFRTLALRRSAAAAPALGPAPPSPGTGRTWRALRWCAPSAGPAARR